MAALDGWHGKKRYDAQRLSAEPGKQIYNGKLDPSTLPDF
jgi:hypothetical protein